MPQSATIKDRVVRQLAASYIVGEQLTEAIEVCRTAATRGWHSAICPWNGDGDTPETVAASYESALQAIAIEPFDCHLSVKVPALKYDFETLTTLLELAATHRIRVHFDSHGLDSAGPSFSLLEKAVTIHADVGCTLPSCWRRSLADAERLIDLGIAVRVVKGQWLDPAEPERDPRAGFLDLIDVLAGRAAQVGVATHDVALASDSLRRLQRSGTPCQLEQLFGLPLHTIPIAERLGVTIRLYVPYGHAWLPYALSHIRRRPIILAWIARDFLLGRRKRLI